MLRSTTTQAFDSHLAAHILRQQGNVRFYWIELRLCLARSNTPVYQRKKDKLLAETETADQLKTNIIETIVSSQFDFLLAMALRANQEAKLYGPANQYGHMVYDYKHFLLNALIADFAEKKAIAIGEFDQNIGIPQLVIRENEANRLVYDLRFFIGYGLFAQEDGKVAYYAAKKDYAIGFHMPKNHVIGPVKKAVETVALP